MDNVQYQTYPARFFSYLAKTYENINWKDVGSNIVGGAKKVAKEALPVIVNLGGKLVAGLIEYGPIGFVIYGGMQAIANSYTYIFYGCFMYFDPMMDLKAYFSTMSKGVFWAVLGLILMPVLKPLAESIRDSSKDLADSIASDDCYFYNHYIKENPTAPVIQEEVLTDNEDNSN